MFHSPLVLGIEQIVDPSRKPLDEIMKDLGWNSGNILFSSSIRYCLDNARMSVYDLTPAKVEESDCVVIAAANWLSSHQDFSWLCDALERTKLPVFAVGLGAQSALSLSIPKLKPGTIRLLDIINDSSKSISVRGEFTAEVLEHYGFSKSTVTGCPSLLLAGRSGFSIPSHDDLDDSGVVVHATRHLFHKSDNTQNYLYRQAISRDLDIVLQSEIADMYHALGRTNNPSILQRASIALMDAYGVEDAEVASKYLSRKGNMFFNLDDWIKFLSGYKFCFGTRIHGTVAALLAGIVGVLVAHDSRTEELARTMRIPFILPSDLTLDRDLDFPSLMASADVSGFLQNYPLYRQKFVDFFEENELPLSSLVRC